MSADALRDWKWEVELQMVVSPFDVGARNLTPVLCKRNMHS